MQVKRKESVRGNFAKKGTDIKAGDMIKLVDEGKIIEGQYGEQNVFTISANDQEFLLSVNPTSLNAMIDEWGEDTTKWIGQVVHVHMMKQNVSGKFRDVYYIAPHGYNFGESGFEKAVDLGVSDGDQTVGDPGPTDTGEGEQPF